MPNSSNRGLLRGIGAIAGRTNLRHFEVWLEKDTLRALVRDVIAKWDVTLRVSTGSFSRPSLVRAANGIAAREKPTLIFYCGDFDPSGIAIESSAMMGNDGYGHRRREGLFDILQRQHSWTHDYWRKQIRWRRIAATEEDFQDLNLAPYRIPIKEATDDSKGDPRSLEYKERYGDLCMEIEALEVLKVGEIAERLDRAIQGAIDLNAWKESERKEAAEKRTSVSIP